MKQMGMTPHPGPVPEAAEELGISTGESPHYKFIYSITSLEIVCQSLFELDSRIYIFPIFVISIYFIIIIKYLT